MTRRRQDSSPLDLPRQLFVTLAALVMAVGALMGNGVISKIPVLKDVPWLRGVPQDQAGGGWLAPGMTLFSPSKPAFWIWIAIYVGLIGYTVWQWRGSHHDDPRYRESGWPLGLAMIGTTAWIWITQHLPLWWSVPVLALIVVCAYLAVRGLAGRSVARSVATRVAADAGPGLLLGWTTIALVANLATAAASSGFRPGGWLGQGIGIAVLLVLLVLSGVYIRTLGPRLSVAAGLVWGLGWIAWARIMEHPYAPIFGWANVGVAIMIAFLTIGALIHVSTD